MEHKKLDEIQRVARVVSLGSPTMSRRERLERWAELLERDAQRRLTPLQRLEFLPDQKRDVLRSDNSPISVAFEDPVLRSEGLASDRFGDAKAFFELPMQQAHYLLCDCHYEGTLSAGQVAARLRSMINRVTFGDLWYRMRGMSS